MARGLPNNFALDLPPQEGPVQIGDFLDEPPPVHVGPKRAPRVEPVTPEQPEQRFTPSIVPDRGEGESRTTPFPSIRQKAARPKPSRLQVNLTPKTEDMFAEVMEHDEELQPVRCCKCNRSVSGITRSVAQCT